MAKQLRDFYEAAGGFGTLLIVTGKKWATREKVFRSMRLFMEHVAPKLRDLVPDAGDQEFGHQESSICFLKDLMPAA